MFYILAVIIVVYATVNIIYKKNETFVQLRHFVDIATIMVTTIFIFVWFELFSKSFWFLIYFILSAGLIIYLLLRLNKIELKKKRAEETIKVLKDEEKVLESEIEELEKDKVEVK